jgi:hypothetical protein
MKRAVCLVLAGFLASSALSSMTYYVVELRGGSRILASDVPVRKGRLTLFHRHPDGAYMSVSSAEVVQVESAQETPRQADRFLPGDTVYIGPALQGPSHATVEAAAGGAAGATSSGSDGSMGYGYGYWGYGWGGAAPPPRPVPPGAGSNIGPNGFPILAPRGSAGSTPPPIGANGFPILAPQKP